MRATASADDHEIVVWEAVGVKSFGLSVEQQEQLWVQWRSGESLRLIAQSMGVSRGPMRRHVKACGGVRPPARRRGRLSWTAVEREEISRGIAAGATCRANRLRETFMPCTGARAAMTAALLTQSACGGGEGLGS